ncbi:MAG: rhomboid family intramembrane serine protease, partial [Proteobacteria bacterium]|nr:rhomboid family intramembrane serine protease [Pseudomonadota bacterium]
IVMLIIYTGAGLGGDEHILTLSALFIPQPQGLADIKFGHILPVVGCAVEYVDAELQGVQHRLLGNVIIGGIIIHFLCKILGSGLGWFLVLVAGTAGNAFNILLRTGQHLSVGFSTAVFGAIGILTGLELKRQFRIKGVLLPLGAGLSLLAMLGSGGERTDLGAHFWGLAVGCGIGVLVASFPVFLKWCNAWQRQLFFLAVSLLIVLGCWQLAFS